MKITETVASSSIIGESLEYYDIAGELRTFKITEDAIVDDDITMIVLPFETDVALELRVCWRIGIGESSPDWYVFIDANSGDMITTWTLFVS